MSSYLARLANHPFRIFIYRGKNMRKFFRAFLIHKFYRICLYPFRLGVAFAYTKYAISNSISVAQKIDIWSVSRFIYVSLSYPFKVINHTSNIHIDEQNISIKCQNIELQTGASATQWMERKKNKHRCLIKNSEAIIIIKAKYLFISRYLIVAQSMNVVCMMLLLASQIRDHILSFELNQIFSFKL